MEEAAQKVFDFIGGNPALDFVNTVGGWREEGFEREYLDSYSHLLAWSKQAGLLTAQQADHLFALARKRPQEAEQVLDGARKLRETSYRIFLAQATGKPARQTDLDALNDVLGEVMCHARVVATSEGYAWGWEASKDALDRMIWPVARAAADLLTSSELERVRQCAGDTCGWLFLDTTKNRSRHWCDMRDCGNRAKARRHYHRTRALAG
jgi:predicted RNA-binding Zn ribbon-like protein